MAGKPLKKGKNPGAVDAWLDTLGYYRKNIAFDETCLFRATAEQIFASQLHHEKVRKECIEYARDNYEQFQHLSEKGAFFERMDKLSKHMAVCSAIELQIISKCYRHDIILFDGFNHTKSNITSNNYDELLLLCETSGDHYDSVFKKDYIQAAGICQSIVYTVLYENVFNISNTQDIVREMLYDKTFSNNYTNEDEQMNKEDAKNDTSPSSIGPVMNWAPFPFKVAKALDPTIYRNIEYDTWAEMRKELRLGDWYNGDDNLTLGTRCKLKTNDTIVLCYLQNFIGEKNKCVVYITSLAEKRIVDYKDLSPEDDAKPWPLPYRFRKNSITPALPEVTVVTTPEKETTCTRKRKDKKKPNKISGEKPLTLNIPKDSTPMDVSLYEGCPLQIQDDPKPEPVQINNNNNNVEQCTPVISEMPLNDESAWKTSQNPSIWNCDAASPNINNFSLTKFVPTTPEHSFTDSYFYYPVPENYNNNTNNNNNNNLWPDCNYDSVMVPNTPNETENVPNNDAYNYSFCNDNRVNTYPNQPTILTPLHDRSIYPIPMTPTSPMVEMYSPPMYNQAMPPAEMIPSPIPLPMYSPPIAYVYPQNSTPTWYPHAINAQGFVFPTAFPPPTASNRH